MKNLLLILVSLALFTGCDQGKNSSETTTVSEEELNKNPAAEGFNWERSNPQAIKIADDVMEAMGGRKNWDETRFISWNFFDVRKLWWDKWTGDVRVKYLRNDMEAMVNINTGKGRVVKDGEEMTNPDSLTLYLNRAKSAWINDSYWLVMPFKLKDSGVTLNYIDVDTTMDGRQAYLLDLKFEGVGDTPQNYYQVWVDTDSRLVSQWAFYREITQEEPNFVMPWKDYKDFGGIKLSGNRGERSLTEIQVHESLPDNFFQDFSTTNI